jgi:hypothetical protein
MDTELTAFGSMTERYRRSCRVRFASLAHRLQRLESRPRSGGGGCTCTWRSVVAADEDVALISSVSVAVASVPRVRPAGGGVTEKRGPVRRAAVAAVSGHGRDGERRQAGRRRDT